MLKTKPKMVEKKENCTRLIRATTFHMFLFLLCSEGTRCPLNETKMYLKHFNGD